MTHSRWSMDAVGSTRAVGLLRIALALIIWARYAREMGLYIGWNGGRWLFQSRSLQRPAQCCLVFMLGPLLLRSAPY